MSLQGWDVNSWKRFVNGNGNFLVMYNEQERFGKKTVNAAKIEAKEQ